MAEPFDLDKWTEEYELSADTLKVMADKGFNSMNSIRKLNPDLIKKRAQGTICGTKPNAPRWG